MLQISTSFFLFLFSCFLSFFPSASSPSHPHIFSCTLSGIQPHLSQLTLLLALFFWSFFSPHAPLCCLLSYAWSLWPLNHVTLYHFRNLAVWVLFTLSEFAFGKLKILHRTCLLSSYFLGSYFEKDIVLDVYIFKL